MKRIKISNNLYQELYKNHNYRCKICNSFGNKGLKRPLCVDHCHKTNKIRGLLCHKCNTAIGLLNDSIDLLYKSIKYLEASI